jgi:aminoglycoside phosphotransferase (APT) family kinase protein
VETDLDATGRLEQWLSQQMPEATDVRVEGAGHVEFGYSADMSLLTVRWSQNEDKHSLDVVLRARPPEPGLLEPYDLRGQFEILKALEATAVQSPKALWIDETGEVTGRPFYIMERLQGDVYEQDVPEEIAASPERIRRMAEHVIEEIATIHRVDLSATGLERLSVGHDYIDLDLAHWADEMNRVKRGPLPALERLHAELVARRPEPTPQVTLIHGDAKGGNFAFVNDEVSAVFDWEMTTVGDPMSDIGWVEVTWKLTPPFSALSSDEFEELLAHYAQLAGVVLHDRSWYRAYQTFKMTIILLIGAMLFDQGHSDDRRFADMAFGIPFITKMGLAELGINEKIESGPVRPREERLK